MTTDTERFWANVDKADCWMWNGSMFASGYGRFHSGGATFRAHRLAYIWEYGEIPEGLQLDHLCRNRRCVRPDHMEAVTSRTNTLRGVSPVAENAAKSFCLRGHRFTPENTYYHAGRRHCRACRTAFDHKRRSREGIA